MSAMNPPSGWYKDPAGAPWMRWWDGGNWTGYTSSGGGPEDPRPLYEQELQIQPWARAAAIALPALSALNGLLIWASASSWEHLYHRIGLMFDHLGDPGYVPRTLTAPPTAYVGYLAVIPLIIILVWQYRTARTARALGRPARYSPGWGVGFWFVPVVQFWMPAQALADCLPPGHPLRSHVWKLWVLYLASGLLATSLIVTLPLARPAGLVSLAVLLLAEALLARLAARGVDAIGDDHREALGTRPDHGTMTGP